MKAWVWMRKKEEIDGLYWLICFNYRHSTVEYDPFKYDEKEQIDRVVGGRSQCAEGPRMTLKEHVSCEIGIRTPWTDLTWVDGHSEREVVEETVGGQKGGGSLEGWQIGANTKLSCMNETFMQRKPRRLRSDEKKMTWLNDLCRNGWALSDESSVILTGTFKFKLNINDLKNAHTDFSQAVTDFLLLCSVNS